MSHLRIRNGNGAGGVNGNFGAFDGIGDGVGDGVGVVGGGSSSSISNPFQSRNKSNRSKLCMIGVIIIAAIGSALRLIAQQLEHRSDNHTGKGTPHQEQPMQQQQHKQLRVPQKQAAFSVGAISSSSSSRLKLVLDDDMGTLWIRLRPDLSKESLEYIRELVRFDPSCKECNFYRAENDKGILQGIMKTTQPELLKQMTISSNTLPRGSCPRNALAKHVSNKCPEHDPHCACHGPIMTQGMIGWAGGGTGPDFFINNYKNPATHWGTQHTVWGEIIWKEGDATNVLDRIFGLPKRETKSMVFLKDKIHFSMELV